MRRYFLVLLETCLILAGLALGLSAWKMHSALEQPLKVSQEQLLEVPRGTTPTRVFYRMEANGVLDDAFWLRLYWRFNLAGTPLHVGEYRMAPGMSVRDLIGVWQRGEMVQYNLTLVEGWTFRQVRAALARHEKIDHTLDGLSDSEVMDKLGHHGVFPEGRFFPDTYRFVRGVSDVDLLQQAYSRLEEILLTEWNGRASDAPYTDPYQALIMASLVEKETGVPRERRQIAGVFVRRMQTGMLLQTDPTVIYGMGERYNGKLTRADLRESTPYNTYVIPGLPPTPIAMVGREAIHAALNPAHGSALYFVARGDGSHVFSDDLDAHNAAVREYQLKRRADYRSSPGPMTESDSAAEEDQQQSIPETGSAPESESTPDSQPEPAPVPESAPTPEPTPAPPPESTPDMTQGAQANPQ
ncbi:endolytic transglycosylase MltG [Pseudomonas akapageensis]|uniref:endolytic transglycosylase MltG n=1 Tax=Pseudomonas akapageensis TaxID=2609961 RepID=UPI00140D996F